MDLKAVREEAIEATTRSFWDKSGFVPDEDSEEWEEEYRRQFEQAKMLQVVIFVVGAHRYLLHWDRGGQNCSATSLPLVSTKPTICSSGLVWVGSISAKIRPAGRLAGAGGREDINSRS